MQGGGDRSREKRKPDSGKFFLFRVWTVTGRGTTTRLSAEKEVGGYQKKKKNPKEVRKEVWKESSPS